MFLSYTDRGLLPLAGPLIKPELGLSATQFGIAVSAFFWVYAPGQYVSGTLVDRWSARLLFGVGVAIWGAATLLFALVAGFPGLVAVRLMLGLGQSFLFTAGSKLLVQYRPSAHRGRDNGLMLSGIALGGATGNFLGGLVMAAQGWRTTALLFGAVTLAWLLPWRRLVVQEGDRKTTGAAPVPPLPWTRILRERGIWASALGHFCNNYGFYFLLTWLPLYLVGERGYSLAWMGTVTALGFLAQFLFALGSGVASDRLIAAGQAEHRVRKGLQVFANLLMSTAIILLAFARSDAMVVAAILLAGAMMGIVSAQNFAIPQIFAGPRACGRWVGFQNGSGNFSGIIGPVVTGMLVDASGDFQSAFALAAGITLGAAVCWAFAVPRVTPVDWGAK